MDPKHGLLGLKLTKTASFMNLLETKINSAPDNHVTQDIEIPIGNGDTQTLCDHVKIKASNVSMIDIEIGDWEYKSKVEGDLVAKVYYARKRLVWEFLEGGLKCKMDMPWSHVTAINLVNHPNQPQILLIQLGEPPLFYRETRPQPRKHTHWEQTCDFTAGRASLYRRHRAFFLPGILDQHFENLVRCNPDFLILSERPFPSDQDSCPYFQPPNNAQHNIPGLIEPRFNSLPPHYNYPLINHPPILRNPSFQPAPPTAGNQVFPGPGFQFNISPTVPQLTMPRIIFQPAPPTAGYQVFPGPGFGFNARPRPLLTMPRMRDDDSSNVDDDGNLLYPYQGRG